MPYHTSRVDKNVYVYDTNKLRYMRNYLCSTVFFSETINCTDTLLTAFERSQQIESILRMIDLTYKGYLTVPRD